MSESSLQPTRLTFRGPILLIVGGLLLWGVFHATGAYLSLARRPGWSMQTADIPSEPTDGSTVPARPRPDPRKAVVVAVCTLTFIGFWAACMAVANRRRQRLAERLASEGTAGQALNEQPSTPLPIARTTPPADQPHF